MKYKMHQIAVPCHWIQIVSRQYKQTELDVHSLSKSQKKQLQEIRKEIQKQGLPSKYLCKKLPAPIGHGIFLKAGESPIEKGDVIGPYTGEVILCPQNSDEDGDYTFDLVSDLTLTKDEQALFDSQSPFHPRRLYAVQLDAKKKGSFTRYINHSHKPNVEAMLVATPECPYQIVYVAKKKILPSEQLLVDYDGEQNSYWAPLGIQPVPMTARTFRVAPNGSLVSNL